MGARAANFSVLLFLAQPSLVNTGQARCLLSLLLPRREMMFLILLINDPAS